MTLNRKEPQRSIHVIFSVDDSNSFRCCFFASIFLICLLPRCEIMLTAEKQPKGFPRDSLTSAQGQGRKQVCDAENLQFCEIFNFIA